MRNTIYLPMFDLQLFNGGAGAGGAGGAAGDGGAAGGQQGGTGTLPKADTFSGSGRSRRSGSGDLQNVVYGKAPDADAAKGDNSPAPEGNRGEGNAKTAKADTPEAKRAAFKALIDGEYKQEFTEMFQGAFNDRYKGMKGLEKTLNDQQPIMDLLMQRHGIADGDTAKLLQAIKQDDVYWEDLAAANNMSVEEFQKKMERDREFARIEQENAELKKQRQREQAHTLVQKKLDGWYAEAEQLKATYPAFDFRMEAQNKDFTDLLKLGYTVQKAYETIHMDEIMAERAKQVESAVGQQMAARRTQKAARPKENGTSAQSAAPVRKDRASELDRADRKRIAELVARGVEITF